MDKQIIIDGVDVNGCIYFSDGYCNDKNDGFKCNLNSEHCYYKQLKRKERECEELKKTCDILALKRKRDFSDYQFQYKECQETIRTYLSGYSKLKATLTEIKEIITTALEQNALINLDKILQKINECEVLNDR